ncbi:MAG: PEGA domain-containing protein [Vicinamibacterales bacterium]
MELAQAPGSAQATVADGFGVRHEAVDPETGGLVECLAFDPALVDVRAFGPAVADRVSRLQPSRHGSFARVRRVDRPAPRELVLVSDLVPGWRLSALLDAGHAARVPLDIGAALGLLRQLIPAVALVSRHQKDFAIGTIAVERLIVSPPARLVLPEYVLGPAVEALQFSRDRLWRSLGVAMPPAPGLPRVTPRADVIAIGVVALALVLGRRLGADEFPVRLAELLAKATEWSGGTSHPLSEGLKGWLGRALQLDARTAFKTAREAQVAFEEVLAAERAYVTTPVLLEAWVQRTSALLAPVPARSPAVLPPSEPPAAPAPEPAGPAEPPAVPVVSPPRPRVAASPLRVAAAVLAALVVLEAGTIWWLATRDPVPVLAGEGELVVQSRPTAARVAVDGEERGVTPLTVRLPPGTHVLEVRVGRSEPRIVPLTIQAGVQTAQYIELQHVALTGGLEVRSEPPRARVLVDGQLRGTTPLSVAELAPGEHDVVVQAGTRSITQRVRIEPGVTAQLVVPLPPR